MSGASSAAGPRRGRTGPGGAVPAGGVTGAPWGGKWRSALSVLRCCPNLSFRSVVLCYFTE